MIERKFLPMLAFRSQPFDSQDFLFEIKYDGTRTICYFEEKNTEFINRRGKEFSYRYPEIKEALKKAVKAKEAVLDGEIVVLENGKPNFWKLAEREHVDNKFRTELLSKLMPATYIIFDILFLNGKELTNLPLLERKRILEKTIEENERIKIAEYKIGSGKELFEFAKKNGLEGIMAKKIDSIYEMGKRSKNWLKIKVENTLDVVIVGYTTGTGEREDFGSLLVAAYHQGKLKFLGRVGTGFSKEEIEEIIKKLEKEKVSTPSISLENVKLDLPEGREAIWVKPKYVCEVKFLEFTEDMQLRAPVFVRMREDKSVEECEIEA
jgi:bifunctional non-homologous end joining protein LigD